MFSKTSFLGSEKLFPDSESEVVQSLTEFRVFVQRIIVREQTKKERKQLYRFLPQTGSSPVPLALPRRVPQKCNIRLQVAQSHKKETSQCSRQFQETSMLNHTRKRLLCSRTTPRDFLCSITTERDFYDQGQLQETSFAQSQLKETYLNNYKELNKVLNT